MCVNIRNFNASYLHTHTYIHLYTYIQTNVHTTCIYGGRRHTVFDCCVTIVRNTRILIQTLCRHRWKILRIILYYYYIRVYRRTYYIPIIYTATHIHTPGHHIHAHTQNSHSRTRGCSEKNLWFNYPPCGVGGVKSVPSPPHRSGINTRYAACTYIYAYNSINYYVLYVFVIILCIYRFIEQTK